MPDSSASPAPTTPATSSRRRAVLGLVVVASLVIASIAWIAWPTQDDGTAKTRPTPPSLPPLEATPFANATADKWIGSSACAECHNEIADTYAQSSHATALADVSLDKEPADAEFQHAATGRRYRVYRQGDQLRHQESVTLEDGSEFTIGDHPVSQVVGTGHQGRTYLVELDGFLVQSPITWYARNRRWRLAPGYDRPGHLSFERPIPVDCLVCHAGRSESVARAYHRVKVHEQTIGCERCHGSGHQHASARRSGTEVAAPDRSIVHPGRLDREHLESICAQCHLQNNTAANLRGRRLTEFRPGHRLAEFRAHYVLDDSGGGMTVVGHVEQLHQSRCYSETKTLTCTTCHDPHGHGSSRGAAARADAFRAHCIACHQPAECGLPADGTRRQGVQDRCVSCHMPQTTTEIPHVASTHHRIGIHSAGTDDSRDARRRLSPGNLVALYNLDHLPSADQDRCLGLAYRQLASKQTDPQLVSTFRLRGHRLLQKSYQAGLDDPELLAALADLGQSVDPGTAAELARRALDSDAQLTEQDRVNSLAVVANGLIAREQFSTAIPVLKQLVTLHRSAVAWLQLSQCHMSVGDDRLAIEAAETAVKIGPQRPELHEFLARLCESAGRDREATRHRAISKALVYPRGP